MFTLDNFYKSEEWVTLTNELRLSRANENGDIICAHCGKPITKKYDAICHHTIELTNENVNDYMISLNSDIIDIVHHKCHNDIHDRFGCIKPKQVYLVYGPPCAGKSTWVKETAGKNDIILDMDSIWEMISNNERYVKPERLKQNVFVIRDCILDMIICRTGKWQNAYIIGGYPFASERERMCNRLGATSIFISEIKETCINRAQTSDRSNWVEYINDWFEKYTT